MAERTVLTNRNTCSANLPVLLIAFAVLAGVQPGLAEGQITEKEFREFFDEFFDRFIRVFDDLIIEQLRKDAGEGDVEAQFHLGYMYAEGELVPKDNQEAAKWYRKAAEQGDSKAQFFLGHMYYEGEGTHAQDRL